MKLDSDEHGFIRLTDIFSPIILQSDDKNENITIRQKDGIWEIKYSDIILHIGGKRIKQMERNNNGKLIKRWDNSIYTYEK